MTIINNLLEYALSLAGKVDKAYARSFNYAEIAGVYLDCGQKSRCLDTLAEGLRIIESLKRPEEKSDRLAWFGSLYAQAGDPVKAGEFLSRAVLLAGASAPAEVVSGLFRAIGGCLDAGLRDNAEKITRELYKAVFALENDTDKTLELINIADIYRELEQNERAQEVLAEALKISLTLKDSWFKAERLIDAAGEYLEIGLKDKAVLVIRDAVAATGSTGEENQPYFLLKIADLYIAANEISRALEVLSIVINLVKADESAYSRSKIMFDAAEKYHQLGKTSESLQLAAQSLEVLQQVQEIEDKISGYAGIAALLGDLGQSDINPSILSSSPSEVKTNLSLPSSSPSMGEELKERVTPRQKALEISVQALELCGKVADKKTRVYLLGTLTLLFGQLNEDEKASLSITEILNIQSESALKTQGLGTVVMDLAVAGKFVPALRLVKVIQDPHIKSSAIANLTGSLFKSGQVDDALIKKTVEEVIGRLNSS